MSWDEDKQQLEYAIAQITEIATGFGLNFFPMRYEICPSDTIYSFGAYGMPTRYNHWSFGKSFHRMKLQYDHGLSKIYELVINSDPCYAFLLDGNSLIQNKLIVAHVLAHSDFFKNNVRFSATNRDMVESMSASASRIRQYEIIHGTATVEAFIDAAMAIQEHINPSVTHPYGMDRNRAEQKLDKDAEKVVGNTVGVYDDLWAVDQPKLTAQETQPGRKKFPARPEKDLLWFIGQYSRRLEPWQQDVLGVIRDEMYYFWPQLETKIMNEGWASYWHLRIMREMELTTEETVEFARLNASVLQTSRYTLNPYYLGLKIFEDIERRWDRAKLFEVREYDMDISFIRNYLTKELVEELDLYVFEKQGSEWKITEKAWENVREQLIESRVNGGFPFLIVEDGDYADQGDMYIRHAYEGIELDLKYVEKTLPYLQYLWGKAVHLETIVEGKNVLFSYDGTKHNRKFMG
jgi:stage V sporulation protein R